MLRTAVLSFCMITCLAACNISASPDETVSNFYASARTEAPTIATEREYEAFLAGFGEGCVVIRNNLGWNYNPGCWRVYTELTTMGEQRGFHVDPHNNSVAARAARAEERDARNAARAAATTLPRPLPTEGQRRHPACDRPMSSDHAVAVNRGLC